ncbi:hypothetical protein [Amycolatopsis sp. PS_44_ISF1]|uniref:hypothetical protein n=1 Tax=Amycolatopsis sp. PS_44_ISF1 TaxID=2974917 RepID=UPI0028DEC52D|nr:hypothetical protein [Amycolatopsis sp. PS_44_ISF1]MDT8915287.1 hypothetical protein [Amycolatopsis sp. PS_44_ISF1]
MPDGIQTNIDAITEYTRQLPYYEQEAGKFGARIDDADVGDQAWGVVGVFAKQGYTDHLADLRSLLEEMKTGVDALTGKLATAARMYQGAEDAGKITFGRYEAEIDGAGSPGA